MFWQCYLFAVGHVVVVGVVEAWRLQYVVDEEIGDAQSEQGAGIGGELLSVDDIVAVDGAKQYMSVGDGSSRSLGDECLVDAVYIRIGVDHFFAGVEGTDIVIGTKPYVPCRIERDTHDFLGRKTVGRREVLKQVVAILVLTNGTTQSATICAQPHLTIVAWHDKDNVAAPEDMFLLFRIFHPLNYDPIVTHRHDQDAIGGTCPDTSLPIPCHRAYLHIGIAGIAAHHIIGMVGHVFAVFVFDQHVDTSVIGGHPYMTVFIEGCGVGFVRAQRIFVIVVMGEVDDVVTVACMFQIEDTVVLCGEPVVSLVVDTDAVDASKGLAVVVLLDDRLATVLGYHQQTAVLVAYQQYLTLLVIAEGTYLVVTRLI